MIIVILGSGPMRFTELKRAVGGISQRTLTLTLRGLERDGLVTKTQFEKIIPPRVDYELTALGCSLRQIVEPFGAWARAHMSDMKRARETYDKRDETLVLSVGAAELAGYHGVDSRRERVQDEELGLAAMCTPSPSEARQLLHFVHER